MKSYLTGLLGSAVLVATTTTLQAEEQNAVIVTATRTAQTVDESLASVSVISEVDIQRSQANSLQDLLQAYAGVDVRNNGGPGKTTSIFLRGTNSNHVLVLIDGIKIGSATSGGASFQDIPVAQIERIEIVRGPRSSLYGSEAIGGVIQIFTKKGKAKSAIDLSVGYGSYNTESYTLGLSGSSEKSDYTLSASAFNTDGINAHENDNPDKDGYENISVNTGITHKISSSSSIKINILHSKGSNQYDAFSTATTDNSEFIQQVAGVNLSLTPTNTWKVSLTTGLNRDESNIFKDGSLTNTYVTRRKHAGWKNDLTINKNNLFTFGIDYSGEEVETLDTAFSQDYGSKNRDNAGIYLQHQWFGGNDDVLFGLRNDDNENFGTHNTGNIAWGHNISKQYRVIASYGTGFAAPTFNQLYWPGAGDPNLKPEESESYEFTFKSKHGWGYWDLSLYRTEIENLISGWPPANVAKAEINGIEFRLSGRFIGLQHHLDLSYTDPRDKETDNILRRRSRKSVRYAIDQSAGKFNYGLTFIGQGEQFDDTSNNERISGYGLVNIRTSYVFNKEWTLRAKIDNVFDKDYESIETYNTAGTSGFISIHYQGM